VIVQPNRLIVDRDLHALILSKFFIIIMKFLKPKEFSIMVP
jgi:hypothetical protein